MSALESTSIRVATRNDLETVLELAGELFAEVTHEVDGDARTTAQRLLSDEPNFVALLAFRGGEAAGLVTISQTSAIYAGGAFGWIHEFYVRPAARSAGIGRALLRELRRLGMERKWRRLEVTAAPRAVKFYRGNGFVDTGPHLKLPLT